MLNSILFFLIAVLYASVGFGGGSGYIAILSLSDMEPSQLRFMALCCNIVVVTGGTIIFVKERTFELRKALPFVITSVPFALIGGAIQLNTRPFFIVLAVTLLIAGILMLIHPESGKKLRVSSDRIFFNLSVGGIIGFVSGLVGIGGGIFLSPILHLIGWDKARTIAATASFFILVNSISGLIGQVSFNAIEVDWKSLLPLLLAVLVGGQIGSRLHVKWLSPRMIKIFTAVLVIFASLRMVIKLIS